MKERAWKARVRDSPAPRVRIPLSPPAIDDLSLECNLEGQIVGVNLGFLVWYVKAPYHTVFSKHKNTVQHTGFSDQSGKPTSREHARRLEYEKRVVHGVTEAKRTPFSTVFLRLNQCYFFWLLMNANASRASETALTLRLICATLPSGAITIVSRL